uniref:C2 domain-containing protein n=1 Tax=Macrostomum lignano TaxID=282301 RepID=A0A1I8FNL4_9PLAT
AACRRRSAPPRPGTASDTHELPIRLDVRVEEIRLLARLGDGPGRAWRPLTLAASSTKTQAALLLLRLFTGSLSPCSAGREAQRKRSSTRRLLHEQSGTREHLATRHCRRLERAVDVAYILTETDCIAKQQQQKQSLPTSIGFTAAGPLKCSGRYSAEDATITTIITVGRSSRAVSNGHQQPGSNTRYLVKVIKASSLPLPPPEHSGHRSRRGPDSLYTASAKCPMPVWSWDEPYQRHVTGSVFGSANPYWDQHYMLRLSMHVFDRSGRLDTLLGSASMRLSELPELGSPPHHAAAASGLRT